MDEKILSVGIKIEMIKLKNRVENNSINRITYVSQIMDMDGKLLTCAMPIYEGHIIPLETGSEYDVYFYTKKGIYKATCRVVSRGKDGNVYICQLALLTSLEKFQRRQFYRLPCTIDVELTPLTETEMLGFIKNQRVPESLVNPVDKGIAVDISGGGMRVISDQKYDKDTYVAMDFLLGMPNSSYRMVLLGQIVQSIRSETNNQVYDQRIQFREITRDVQDEVVKYIFEEQRRIRKKERLE